MEILPEDHGRSSENAENIYSMLVGRILSLANREPRLLYKLSKSGLYEYDRILSGYTTPVLPINLSGSTRRVKLSVLREDEVDYSSGRKVIIGSDYKIRILSADKVSTSELEGPKKDIGSFSSHDSEDEHKQLDEFINLYEAEASKLSPQEAEKLRFSPEFVEELRRLEIEK